MLWSNAYETGIEKLDEQHRELFRRIGLLLDAVDTDRIPEFLDYLSEYAIRHFGDEQALQALCEYPKAEMHKRTHRAFIVVYADMRNRFETSNGDLMLLLTINKTVIGWFRDHIQIHDKEFAEFYKRQVVEERCEVACE